MPVASAPQTHLALEHRPRNFSAVVCRESLLIRVVSESYRCALVPWLHQTLRGLRSCLAYTETRIIINTVGDNHVVSDLPV